ncbi:PREDICTED: transcription factor PIF6-like isoform X2 [Lupinus angustifolius]|uniref:transcription factor PIF6-like isoform X2 n=1 Tax=Lupinus angustifolius TaxID=3871 RepID=UPI00092E6B53|nr:PREDICTED: transcription factor PIF6-like isoform X2 [Lupinus angustifolius]
MNEKILGSDQISMNENDFLELGCENGEIVVKGGSSNITQHNPSCNNIGYSTINTSHKDEATYTTKRTKLNTLCSFLNNHFPPHNDFNLSSSHLHQTNDQNDLKFSQNNNSFNKLEEDFATIKHEKDSPSSEPNSKKLKYMGNCDQRKVQKVNNFSNFLVPKVFLKSTKPIRNETSAKLEEIEVVKGSKGIKGFHDHETSLTTNDKSNDHVSLVVGRSDEKPQLDDENSEAVAIVRAKGKAKSSLCDEPLFSSSPVWSLEASNDPKFCIMKHEDSDESTYSSRDNDEETEDVVVKETPAQEGNNVKRKRNGETYNLCEKNHRDIMNKKMRILKELIPYCNKVDKASLLDDAINYVKSLKLQLQIMSMSNGLCMPQMMLPQLMGTGMGFTPSTTINPWTPQQLPIPSLSSIRDNNTLQNMFGAFSNQMLQIPPIPHHVPNFMPMMIGNNSSLTTLDVSDLHAKAELCGTNQAQNQTPFNHIPSYYPFYFATNKEENK